MPHAPHLSLSLCGSQFVFLREIVLIFCTLVDTESLQLQESINYLDEIVPGILRRESSGRDA